MDFTEFVETTGKRLALGAGDHVFRLGDADRSVYVLVEGLLKACYLSDEGTEKIKSFIFPGELIGSLASAWRKEACSFNLVCLEPSVLIRLEFDVLLQRSRSDLQLSADVVDHLLAFAMRKEQRERELLTESAQSRYRLLLERAPGVAERIRQKDIARYLGITPVALSRIRKRMAS